MRDPTPEPNSFSRRSLLFVLLNVIITSSTEAERSVVLDKETDIFISWKLKGNYVYYPNGRQLKQARDSLPKDFGFKSFLTSKGIWAIFPEPSDVVDSSYVNSSASFRFSSSAQLMSSVTLTYSMGGKSRITVRQDSANIPFYTISPSETLAYEWVRLNVPFKGTSQVSNLFT